MSSIRRNRCRTLVAVAASRAEGVPRRSSVSGRSAFKESQAQGSLLSVPAGEIASFVVPASLFLAVTFGIAFLIFLACFGFGLHAM